MLGRHALGNGSQALFLSHAYAPIVLNSLIGYGSYDQSATTAHNSFFNRSLIFLKQFPVRFDRYFTTWFRNGRFPGWSHIRMDRTSFFLRWTHLSAWVYVLYTPNSCPYRAIISRQKVERGWAGFTWRWLDA